MSNYKVFQINCNPELAELLIAELSEIGFEGFLENEHGFEAYLEEAAFDETLFNEIIFKYSVDKSQVIASNIAQQNWNALWESSFEPVIVSNKLIIKAPFHNITEKYEYEIIIQPKTSFGTGHHETTQSIMELMLKMDFKNKTVFDYGCGTGVLAILASQLGATNIFANDIDDWAFENVGENAAYNKITNIDYQKGDLSIVPNVEYDIILANINKNILLKSFEQLSKHIKPNGIVLISGFYETDLPDLLNCCQAFGLNLQQKVVTNGWCAALLVMAASC
jgi:ribosomal protein L11 methyltransferase